MCAWEGVRLLSEIEVGACVHERVLESVSQREKEKGCKCAWERGRQTDRRTDRQRQREGGGCLSAWEKCQLREKGEGYAHRNPVC